VHSTIFLESLLSIYDLVTITHDVGSIHTIAGVPALPGAAYVACVHGFASLCSSEDFIQLIKEVWKTETIANFRFKAIVRCGDYKANKIQIPMNSLLKGLSHEMDFNNVDKN
jgi:hypothetical protein